MLTLISGTNRPGSNTLTVSRTYSEQLKSLGAEHLFFSLEELPRDFAQTYMSDFQTPEVKALIRKYVHASDYFVAVTPEYNGTFPGIFKLFIDAISHGELKGKKIALVGVATGRGGNMRGMDQLTALLHYLGMHVYPGHLPISRLRELLDEKGQLTDPVILRAMKIQAEGLLRM